MSLLRRGLCYVESQQLSAVASFSHILPQDTAFIELSDYDVSSISDEEFESESVDINNKDDEYYDEIDPDLIYETGYEIVSSNLGPLFWQNSNDNIVQLVLPSCFSQSTINGRNGSNACAVISLLTGNLNTHY